MVERPQLSEEQPQHLCLDKGYDNPIGHAAVEKHDYVGHIRGIGEERLEADKNVSTAPLGGRANLGAWLSKCRGILVRYETKAENYLALIQFACALIWYR